MPVPPRPVAKARLVCERCGASFDCNPTGDCWCADEAFRMPMPVAGTAQCLCPACLRAAAAAQAPQQATDS